MGRCFFSTTDGVLLRHSKFIILLDTLRELYPEIHSRVVTITFRIDSLVLDPREEPGLSLSKFLMVV